MHKYRERNSKIVAEKKKRVLRDTGALRCEACAFNFEKTYGLLGKGYIECHHLIPLHQFQVNRETRLEDLALMCSNCHQMIHRDLSVRTIGEFRERWYIG
ncbi:MAG: HNH endonuclease [Lewinellaceae bacterium]|nr:HNH endonuclease [Lewinellaceae bacterium]